MIVRAVIVGEGICVWACIVVEIAVNTWSAVINVVDGVEWTSEF